MTKTLGRCGIVPPHLLRRLSTPAAERTLSTDHQFRTARTIGTARSLRPAAEAWTVHDAGNTEVLPGRPVRAAGAPPVGDDAVDEAATGIEACLELFDEVYGRSSYDGRGAAVIGTVHYGRDYDNAFWNGEQLVFGDGDGQIFGRFTAAIDVLAHEFTHGVTEYAAGLVYRDQSGALNESVSDVFATCLKQRVLGQSVEEGDWLIGAGLFLPGLAARGLRDLAAPGTAYDDPRLGADPQVGHCDDYIVTQDDNGGVHLNSGIPNRAFYLAARSIGGSAAEGAGAIWFRALSGDHVSPDADFAAFARATLLEAGPHEEAVRAAWHEVGVLGDGQVRVRRTGGFIGRAVEASVDLAHDERGEELRAVIKRVDPERLHEGRPLPDHFAYEFDLDGQHCRVQQQDLTEDLSRIVRLVLG